MPHRPTLPQVLDQVQTGDVFLFQGRHWYSKAIRYFTQSVYSHVGIAYRLRVNGHSRLCIFEAVYGHGVRLHPMDRYLEECAAEGCAVEWYALVDPAVNRDKVADACLQQWANHYAPLRQFWWSFGLGRFLRRWLNLSADLGGGKFCSWLAALALQHGGYRHDSSTDPTEPALTDPGTLGRYACLHRMGELRP